LNETAASEYKFNIVDKIDAEEILFINGRVLFTEDIKNIVARDNSEKIYLKDDQVVAVLVKQPNLAQIEENINNFSFDFYDINIETEEIECRMITYPWELIMYNMEEIAGDFRFSINSPKIEGTVYSGTSIINENQVFIGEGAIIKPNSVIDAERGPVYIGKNVQVMPNSVIIGPAFIGNESIIKPGATLQEGTNIGEFCKVGGDVYNSILLSYSNKQHDGFMGNSFLASWVNIGAGTTTSDLKNNYGNVRMWVNGELIDSGLKSMGAVIGDFTQTGINTTFNTGTSAGVICNIFGEGFQPKYVSSFLWGGNNNFKEYNLEQGIKTIELVMGMRDKKLSEEFKDLIYYMFNYTRFEREKTTKNKPLYKGKPLNI